MPELQIGGLTTEPRPVVDDFAVDLSRSVVDERHLLVSSFNSPASYSFAKEAVDVFVGNLSERRLEIRTDRCLFLLYFLHNAVEDLAELLGCLLDAQSDQPKGRTLIENNNKNYAQSHDGDMDVISLTFMKKDREFLFTNQLR